MDEVFLDSSWFKAVIDEKDDFHTQANLILDRLEKEESILVTSNYVLDETFTLVRVKCGLEKCRKLNEYLRDLGEQLRIERVQTKDERLAWEWFWEPWSKLSYTDCTSFAVMERLGIKQVATFDEHFIKAGFSFLPEG